MRVTEHGKTKIPNMRDILKEMHVDENNIGGININVNHQKSIQLFTHEWNEMLRLAEAGLVMETIEDR